MSSTVVGLVLLLIGVLAIAGRRDAGRMWVEGQNRTRQRYGEQDVRGYAIVVVAIGLLLAGAGVLVLLGVIGVR